jgi:hypothetical protein
MRSRVRRTGYGGKSWSSEYEQRFFNREGKSVTVHLLTLDELYELPAPKTNDSGIYFLWRGRELLYIGKSRNLCQRSYYQHCVNTYTGQQSKGVKFIPAEVMTCLVVENGPECSPRLDARLQDLERAYIAAYPTPFNLDLKSGLT